jgi:N-dimethylarginine dimethylaminohydrolase
VKGLPDLVFIDAGVIYDRHFISSKFKYPERQPEANHFKAWFADNGFEVHTINGDGSFEGHGDSLWAENRLYLGQGFRTDLSAHKEIESILKNLGDVEIVSVELTDPRFYHLDTCFSPLRGDLALVYTPAIAPDSLRRLEKDFEIITVDERDATKFCCNSAVFDGNLVMPAFTDSAANKVADHGFHVEEVDVSEFIKAGGACKCLSMPLWDE